MSIEQPFNTSDPKYKNVSDLPKEEQKNFRQIYKGKNKEKAGFITKEAALYHTVKYVESFVKNIKRPIKSILTGKDKVLVTDLIEDNARYENMYRELQAETNEERKKEEEKKEKEWNDFLNSSGLIAEAKEKYLGFISLRSAEGETKYSVSNLIEAGLVSEQQLVELCEVVPKINVKMHNVNKTIDESVDFEVQLKEDWTKRLGEILGKNIEVKKA